MKYKMGAFLFPLFLINTLLVTADDKQEPPEPILIKSYQEDLTGDGNKEKIDVKGIPFTSESKYYRDFKIVITSNRDKTWEIKYNGGYAPKINFIDLNHDSVNDILFQSSNGGKGDFHRYKLHTLSQHNLSEIKLPKQEYVAGEFKEDFQVELKLSPISDPIIMDVKKRAKKYTNKGVYQRDGRLIKNTPIIIEPITYFEPVYVSDSKGYGLKSFQQVSGINQSDLLGTIESLWYYEHDKWIIIQSEWIPVD